MRELTVEEYDVVAGGEFTGTWQGMLTAAGAGAIGGALAGARSGSIAGVVAGAIFFGALGAAFYTIANINYSSGAAAVSGTWYAPPMLWEEYYNC